MLILSRADFTNFGYPAPDETTTARESQRLPAHSLYAAMSTSTHHIYMYSVN